MRILPAVLMLLSVSVCTAGEIRVEPGGSLHAALRQAREWRRTGDARCQGGITIRVAAGRYYMSEPLLLRPEDSGTPSSPLRIVGDSGAVLCGDPVQRHTQLWPQQGMERITGFDVSRRTISIPTPPRDILRQLQSLVGPRRSPTAARPEMVVSQRWAMAILRIAGITVCGDSTLLTFLEPESRLEFEHPWPQPVVGGNYANSAFLIRTTEQRDGIERLVVLDGASNVSFERLTFEHTCWNRPLHKGHVTLQGGFPLLDAYKLTPVEGLPWDAALENQAWTERPVSAVSVRRCDNVRFAYCTFSNLGATALDFVDSVSHCTVMACLFDSIGGTAIMAGSFAEFPREVHRPYSNLASRCRWLSIVENSITNASLEDWGAVGISCGYVSHALISGNSVGHVNYSGICVGWGWTPLFTGMSDNTISYNHVSDYARQLYDAGGIYTLSNQPRSLISGNTVSSPAKSPYATNRRAFPIYLDARTDGYTISGNRCDNRPLTRTDIGTNHPGPSVDYSDTPASADSF